jgi:DNA-binding YbaB/EbfC family protein
MFDQLKALSQLGPMMAKAKEMQAKMQEVQARLPHMRASAEAGGGLVTVVANGQLDIVSITYATSAPLTDTELLADLTRAAVNQALRNVKELVQKEMEQVTGGMDMGNMRNMLGM